ncbi:MAG: hypothetical protein Q3971_04125 [Moraxella sp.]|nr:hypothetical protein [Moraxella sp.]
MTILSQMINLMLQKVKIKPVPKQELDEFLSQNHINICDDYYQFLLNYGYGDFLKYGYADLTFDDVKLYYLDDEIFDDAKLPPNCDYIGGDLSTEPLCIDKFNKNIYIFADGERDFWYYGGLREILFYYLFGYIKSLYLFDSIKTNIKINDVDKFKSEYMNYEIKDIHFGKKYFF